MEMNMRFGGSTLGSPINKRAITATQATNAAATDAIRNAVRLNQELARALNIKNKILADKATSDAMLEVVKTELATAHRTIAALRIQISELTESLAAANEKAAKAVAEAADASTNSKKQKKGKPAEPEADPEVGVQPPRPVVITVSDRPKDETVSSPADAEQ